MTRVCVCVGTFVRVCVRGWGGCRILQYGQMSMSSEATEGEERVTKASVEAGGDQGLLNLLTDDTVFYVGGYPTTFRVNKSMNEPLFLYGIAVDLILCLFCFSLQFSLLCQTLKVVLNWKHSMRKFSACITLKESSS